MFSRHDLVWLGDSGWDEALRQVPAQLRDPIVQWWRAGWPAVVRRREAGAGEGEVCVGIPLPPDPVTRIKPRVGLRIGVAGIARHCAPLSLADTLAAAPQAWREPLSTLAPHGVRAYGSLAMQVLTGLPYLTPASDADILFRPANRADLHSGVAAMMRAAERMPLDGEIVFPDGSAVAWKEWRDAAHGHGKVLVKSLGAVRLAPPADLIATLEAV